MVELNDVAPLIEELEDLKQSAQLYANDLLREEVLRAKSQGNADAYAYCQERLRNLIGIRAN